MTGIIPGNKKELAERKQAEDALRESEEKFRVLAETSPAAIIVYQGERQVYVNPAATRLIGYTEEECLEMKFWDWTHEDFKEQVRYSGLARQRGEPAPPRYEFKCVTKSGEEKWVVVSAGQIEYKGAPAGIASIFDITEHKRMEEELQHARNELEKRVEERTTELRDANERLQREITIRERTEKVNMARLRLLQFAGNHSLDELLQATLDEAEALTGSLIGFYVFVLEDQKTLSLQNWSTRTKRDYCKAGGKGLHCDISRAGVWTDCIHQRRPLIHNDYATLPHRKGLPPDHATLIRELVVPVFRGDNIVAILGVGNKPLHYTSADVEAVSLLADLAWEITESKRMEEDLLLSHFCINKASIGIFQISLDDGKILRVNDSACQSLGYSSDELCTMSVLDINPSLTWEKFVDSKRKAGFSGSLTFETVHRRKDGTTFPVEITVNNLEFNGKSTGFTFVRDITEQKRAIAELELTQFFVDKASVGIYRISEEGNIIFANEFTCRNLGYTRDELCSMMVFDIDPTFNLEKFREHRKSTRADGSRTFESIHRRKDGSTFPVEITVSYMEYQGKEFSVSFDRDITERKEAEDSIRESRAKYQAIVDSFDGFIYVCSQDYRIEFMNRKLIERTGRDAVGELCYKVLHDRDSVCPWCINDRVFAGETIHWDVFSPKDKRWYEVLNVPIHHADGSMSKHSMMVDITDRKLFEEELQRKKKLLKELNETLERRVDEEVRINREKDIMLIQQNRQAALGEMLDHIAHQWKQPLNSVALIVQDMADTSSDGELTDEYVQATTGKMMALVEHMAQTINVFRGFYRADKDKKVFSIKDSVDQALSFITPALRFHHVAVELDVDPGLTAFGYPKEYVQVLLNILANARDVFSARETEKPRIIIKAFVENNKTVVTITDNAGGIPETILGKIFDLYFTTNETGGGTGIGLFMSKNIIEKNMDGTLSAVNTEDGAQFRIEVELS